MVRPRPPHCDIVAAPPNAPRSPMRHVLLALLICLALPAAGDDKVPNPFAVIGDAQDAMAAKAAENQEWGLEEATHWGFSLEDGTITFTLKDGRVATVPMQIIGTRSRGDDTFLWGWDHPSVPEPLAQHAKRLHAWGEANGIGDITSQMEVLPEEKIWEYTVLAAYLSGAQGVYRPGGDDMPYIYVTFGKPTFSSPPSKKHAK